MQTISIPLRHCHCPVPSQRSQETHIQCRGTRVHNEGKLNEGYKEVIRGLEQQLSGPGKDGSDSRDELLSYKRQCEKERGQRIKAEWDEFKAHEA